MEQRNKEVIMNLKNTWGIYPWSTLHGNELIYSEDLEKATKSELRGKVFHCTDDNGKYITLEYQNESYRVKPDLYEVFHGLVFPIGSSIKLKKYPDMNGIIIDIRWYWDKKEPMYFITLNGKKKTKRYFLEDFIVDKL